VGASRKCDAMSFLNLFGCDTHLIVLGWVGGGAGALPSSNFEKQNLLPFILESTNNYVLGLSLKLCIKWDNLFFKHGR